MNNDNILSCYKIRVNGLTPTGDGNQTLEIFQDHILHVLMALPQQGTETLQEEDGGFPTFGC